MKVPKGKSFHINRNYKAGEEIPDILLPESLLKRWKDINLKNQDKTPLPSGKKGAENK